MFSQLDLCFLLCSLDLDVLRVQRVIGFFILITHKLMRLENAFTWYVSKVVFHKMCMCAGTICRMFKSEWVIVSEIRST